MLTLQKQEAQFKAAELEFHQQQLQHVSEEQRQAHPNQPGSKRRWVKVSAILPGDGCCM